MLTAASRISSLLAFLLFVVAGYAGPAHGFTLHYLEGSQFAQRLPGADFLIGNADDPAFPGFNVGPAPDATGGASYGFTQGAPGGDYGLAYEGTIELNLGAVTLNGSNAVFSDFDVAAVAHDSRLADANGPASTFVDVKTGVHGIVVDRETRQTFTQFTGRDDLISARWGLDGFVQRADLSWAGALILRGQDVASHPAPGLGPVEEAYLNDVVIPMLPADWTALHVSWAVPYLMTGANTTGTLAPFLIGGTSGGISVAWSNDAAYFPGVDSVDVLAGGPALVALVGGASLFGGMDIVLHSVAGGTISLDLSVLSATALAPPTSGSFQIAAEGLLFQWDLAFSGELVGPAALTVAFDAAGLAPGIDPLDLVLFHFESGAWVALPTIVDVLAGTLSATTTSFSPFAIGALVPEPAPLALLGLAALAGIWRPRRRPHGRGAGPTR